MLSFDFFFFIQKNGKKYFFTTQNHKTHKLNKTTPKTEIKRLSRPTYAIVVSIKRCQIRQIYKWQMCERRECVLISS